MQQSDIASYIQWLETIEEYCIEITETMDGDANVLLWLHNECDKVFNNLVQKYKCTMTPEEVVKELKAVVDKMHFVYVQTDNVFDQQLNGLME